MKRFYLWGRNFLQRIDVIGPEDTAKKPQIQAISSPFAKVHQRILNSRRKRK